MTQAPTLDVALRPATPDDRPFLARVYASTREEELAAVPFTAAEKAAFLEQQFTFQSLHYERHYTDTTFDVVLVGGAAAGRLIVGRWEDQVRVVDVALLPEFRGQGVGSRLLGDVIGEADAKGLPVTIYVERFNPAQRLYRRLGFGPASEDPNGIHLFFERPPTGVDDAPRAKPNSYLAEDGLVVHRVRRLRDWNQKQFSAADRRVLDLEGRLRQTGLEGAGEPH